MDYMRSCYYSRMRLFRDRPDVSVPGRWHFCQPNAKLAPRGHVFGSQNWDAEGETLDPPLGEVPGRNGYSKGETDPWEDGSHYCGTRSAWTEGILYADRPGLPLRDDGYLECCHPPVVDECCILTELGDDLSLENGTGCIMLEECPPCLLTELGDDIMLETGTHCLTEESEP